MALTETSETLAAAPFLDYANMSRKEIKKAAAFIDNMKRELQSKGTAHGEVMANLTLAFRHLEDASMRMGKAIQAHEGGKSVYDSVETPGVKI